MYIFQNVFISVIKRKASPFWCWTCRKCCGHQCYQFCSWLKSRSSSAVLLFWLYMHKTNCTNMSGKDNKRLTLSIASHTQIWNSQDKWLIHDASKLFFLIIIFTPGFFASFFFQEVSFLSLPSNYLLPLVLDLFVISRTKLQFYSIC